MRRVLIVYGYHPLEAFAIATALAVKKRNLSNVIVREYEGVRDDENEKSHPARRAKHIRDFARNYYPLSHVIEVHDGRRYAYEEPGYPAAYVSYRSRGIIGNTIGKIESLEDSCSPRSVHTLFRSNRMYISKDFDHIVLELYPPVITRQKAINLLQQLSEILLQL